MNLITVLVYPFIIKIFSHIIDLKLHNKIYKCQLTSETDILIKALGFDPENIPNLFKSPNLQVSKWGTIKINLESMETNIEGVFAAGDIVRGASLVVWAIKDGREAARSIDKYLKFKNLKKTEAA